MIITGHCQPLSAVLVHLLLSRLPDCLMIITGHSASHCLRYYFTSFFHACLTACLPACLPAISLKRFWCARALTASTDVICHNYCFDFLFAALFPFNLEATYETHKN